MASIDDTGLWEPPVHEFAGVLREGGLGYALIGGNARNVWATPLRSTDDFDFVVLADRDAIERVENRLLGMGYSYIRRQDGGGASGPDFVRMVNATRDLFVDLQTAKTEYQELVVKRAILSKSGVFIATSEDLIVMKLIAWRGIDQRDLHALMAREGLDWAYIEHWAKIWSVTDRLENVRTFLAAGNAPGS